MTNILILSIDCSNHAMKQFLVSLICAISLLVSGCRQQSEPATPGTGNKPTPTTSDSTKVETKPTDTQLSVLAWNVESDGSDPETILKQIQALGQFDVIALSEVLPTTEALWKQAFKNGAVVMSSSGGRDRLVIAYNADAWELVRVLELDKYGDQVINPGNHRSPLIVHLKNRTTGYEFMLMNNHLARGKADVRTQQSVGISAWARDQTLPMLAVGDYNFDFDFRTKSGNESFRTFLAAGVWQWVEPKAWVDTNWDDRDGDGKDNYPDSMLDFVFVAGPAKAWQVECEAIVRAGDFPDDNKTSDHRPVIAKIKIPAK
jgi:endonuclease/exonuclease/phosphatase family metal-dependent hydrolase